MSFLVTKVTLCRWRPQQGMFGDASAQDMMLATFKRARSGRVGVNYWGWMSSRGPGELVRVNGKLNDREYVLLLQDVMLPTVRAMAIHDNEPIIFVQDNSPIHTAHIVTEWCRRHPEMQEMDWPAKSCDINPIENLWVIMKQEIKMGPERTCDAIDRSVREEDVGLGKSELVITAEVKNRRRLAGIPSTDLDPPEEPQELVEDLDSFIHVGVQDISSYNMADSRDPEIVIVQRNSFVTSAFAVAIPVMALLAGLAFAVYCFHKIKGTRDLDVLDISEETILEDSMETEDLDDMEQLDETDDDSGTDFDEVARLEDSLNMEQLDEADDDLDTDCDKVDEVVRLEDSLNMEQLDETDDLDTDCDDVDEVARLEDSLNMEQLDDYLLHQIEKLLDDKLHLEEDLRLAQNKVQTLEKVNEEQTDTITTLESHLDEKDLLLKKRDEEERERELFFQQEIAEKQRELKATQQKETELCLKLKESENMNQLLDLENEEICRMNEDLKNDLLEKEKEVDLLKESLNLKTKELEEGQDKREIMKRRLEETEEDNSSLQEKLRLAEKENVSIQQDVLIMQDENQKLQSLLSQAESVAILTNEILNAEKTSHELLGDELQVMKNWVAELGGENAKMKGELKEKTLYILLLEKSLETERRNNNTLQDALHRLKEIENLLEEAKKRKREKDEEVERLQKDNEVYREQILKIWREAGK
ncbi:paramyosin-like [Macrobrachium nipponense]|uniref:paramyosin-like n=1 Tax=Macrobrachium nipponense TaxID=159736 RepID=UPI0030C83706